MKIHVNYDIIVSKVLNGSGDPEHRFSDPGSEIRIHGLGFLDLRSQYYTRGRCSVNGVIYYHSATIY